MWHSLLQDMGEKTKRYGGVAEYLKPYECDPSPTSQHCCIASSLRFHHPLGAISRKSIDTNMPRNELAEQIRFETSKLNYEGLFLTKFH
jgi:hypothetical protein